MPRLWILVAFAVFAAPTVRADTLLYSFTFYDLARIQLGDAQYLPPSSGAGLGTITFTAVGDTADIATSEVTFPEVSFRIQSIPLHFQISIPTLGSFAATDPITLTSQVSFGPEALQYYDSTYLTDRATLSTYHSLFDYGIYEYRTPGLDLMSSGTSSGPTMGTEPGSTQSAVLPTTAGLLSFQAGRGTAGAAAYTAVTPEPPSSWLLGSGALLLLLGAWRRRAYGA